MRPVLAQVPLAGTLINVVAVVAGTGAGVLVGHRLPERIRETVMAALGIAVLASGMDAALDAFREPLTSFSRASVLIVIGSLLLGGIAGEALRIEDRLQGFGAALERRFAAGDDGRFIEGFVVASLVFCVGPLAVLGSIQDGLSGDIELLAIKSLLDGFAALAFASALGIGVGFSVISVIIYQGTITLAARAADDVFSPEMIAALTAVGGLLIIGIGLRLLRPQARSRGEHAAGAGARAHRGLGVADPRVMVEGLLLVTLPRRLGYLRRFRLHAGQRCLSSS